MKYPNGKGIFDVDLRVGRGEAVGFLGPNGAGKTTTIRCILGFMKGDGVCTIDGRDCFENAPYNMRDVGFIAGEPAFPEGMTGLEYLNFLCEVRGITDKTRMHELIEYFEFDPRGKIKRMSKGMKQKTAIVACFMHDPNILILDEPTSGLDPLMQNKFVELLLKEKNKGKTILMSSHMFEEVERTCEHVVIIKDGRIVASNDIATMKRGQTMMYVVNGKERRVKHDEVDKFVKEIAKTKVQSLTVREQTLEEIFLDLYKKKEGAI